MSHVRQVDAARQFEPTQHYADWRRECPVHHEADHSPPFYVLSRFDDIVDVLRHPDLWRNRDGPGVFFQESGVLGTTDDPDHQRHRRVLRAAFVPTAIDRLAPHLRRLTDALIDALIAAVDADGLCDFVPLFAEPLPALGIAELLGVDPETRDDFRRWSNDAVAALSGGDVAVYQAAKTKLEDCIEAGIDARSALRPDERPDDVLAVLASARESAQINRYEARHLGYQLLVAGHETTTSLLGTMLLRLLQHPEAMAALRTDHSLIAGAVEEALRFDSPVHGLFRTNATECAVHGTTIPKGSKLQLAFAAANRDPEQFPDPDQFVIDRDRRQLGHHVAFGWGIHFCIGAPLARLETRIAFEQLLTRLDHIELAGEPQRNDSFVLHGLTSLPIRFTVRQ